MVFGRGISLVLRVGRKSEKKYNKKMEEGILSSRVVGTGEGYGKKK